MLILDTDHLSILDQDTVESFNIARRLASVEPAEVAVSIIFGEVPGLHVEGWTL